ncbi:MAG: hypothetical protein NTU88_00095, partial [Armatimonadetes bacterium]|nr:hypothetical protein [Armatimonadota bacterium]
IALRLGYWLAVAVVVAVIYAAPDKPTSPPNAGTLNLLYYVLLAVALGDLLVMKFFDFASARSAASDASDQQPRKSALKAETMPIILMAFSFSITVYGLVYRLIGGTITRSLSFCLLSLIGYVIFSLAAVRYASQLGTDTSNEGG